MTRVVSIVALLLVALLPALIAAQCRISVTSRLSGTQDRNNVYSATIVNVGTSAAKNIYIKPSSSVRSVSGLKENGDGYSLKDSVVSSGGIAVGTSYGFTYTASKGTNVRWTGSCTGESSAPAATTAPTNTPVTSTKAPTKAPTTKPTATTKAPTTKPTATTKAPTTKPTATTKAPTSAPTTKAPTATTKAPTTAPSADGKICPAGTWWAPAPQTTYQWQLTGTIDQSINVQMYDIDLFDTPASTITALHAKGRVVICYFSTQYENWRPDASSFTPAVLGNNLDDWAGERYVDIRSSVVRNIMAARLDLAASKGCDGVEPDNVDGYQSNTGFPITAADQLSYNKFLAEQAHARGLSIGLKNDLDQATALEPYFDWALNEQCNQYNECGMLNVFINKGKAVFNTEYSGSASSVCPKMVASKFSSLIKSLSLDASIKAQCCTYQSNGCAAASHKCVSSSS